MTSEKVIVQEIEPVLPGLAAATIAGHLLAILTTSQTLKKKTPISKVWSKRLNSILNSGNKWIVHVYTSEAPNAFSLGFGRHIFITNYLEKVLTTDEIIAVLLHEAYHSDKKHLPKNLAVKYPLFFLTFVTAFAFPVMSLAFVAIVLVGYSSKLVYDLTVLRRQEISADSYAVKYGYGKELISALKKIENWIKLRLDLSKCGSICKAMRKVDSLLDEHPETAVRIKRVLEAIARSKEPTFYKIKQFVVKFLGGES